MVVGIKKNELLWPLICSCVAILNVALCQNYTGVLVMTIIEIAVVAYYVLKGDLFVAAMLFFVSSIYAIEMQGCYSLQEIDIGPLNTYIVLSLLLCIVSFPKMVALLNCKIAKRNKYANYFKYFVFMCMMGMLIGIINISKNYEYYMQGDNIVITFLGEIELQCLLPLTMLGVAYVLCEKQKDKVLHVMISAGFGLFVQILFAWISGAYGIYSESDKVLIVSHNASMVFFVLLFADYITDRTKKLMFILAGALAGIVLLFISPSGKNFVFLLFLGCAMIFKSLRSKTAKGIGRAMLAVVGCGVAFIAVLGTTGSSLFNYKMLQFVRLFDVFNPEWFNDLPPSPKFRVAEFFNIINMYVKNPLLAILGRGILGHFTDSLGLFFYYPGAFSDVEWRTGLFFNPHVAINLIILQYGIWGVLFILKISHELVKRFNSILLIGCVWYVLFFGYSCTVAIFGSFCLGVGLLCNDINNEMKQLRR